MMTPASSPSDQGEWPSTHDKLAATHPPCAQPPAPGDPHPPPLTTRLRPWPDAAGELATHRRRPPVRLLPHTGGATRTSLRPRTDLRGRHTHGPIAGPVSGPLLREKALQLAHSLGWRLTIDAFASERNSLLPRFFARYAEPSAESEDAFTVGDWDQSARPKCGRTHRETLSAARPA